jgi:uncharacterized membrane protein YgcG
MSNEPECPRGTPLDQHEAQFLVHALRADRGMYFDVACIMEEAIPPLEYARQVFRSAWVPPFSENGYVKGLEPQLEKA